MYTTFKFFEIVPGSGMSVYVLYLGNQVNFEAGEDLVGFS